MREYMGSGQSPPIAIVGMAFRLPGDIRDEHVLWETLQTGRCCVSQIPADRWPTRELWHNNRSEPGRSVTFAAGVLSDLDRFDAAFFGISPREAAWLDPQQRLLLELAYEAMEHANIPSQSLAGTRCGVYVGISSLDYGLHALEDLASMSAHSMTGNALSIAPNRISYNFNLHGPSLAVDTACSSSLVALHHACQALRAGEIPAALVGGVNLLLHPYSFVGFSKASMLSADGRCRPFDAGANGYVRAEGGAVLLLKPLSQALADGDSVRAVILASGVNTDGRRKTGITIPSIEGQRELMRSVLAQSGLAARDVAFIEAHGTGTAVGDPVEAAAIGQTYGQGRARSLPITSVKANLGHLEPAAGLAGLVKAVLALQHGELPPMPFAFTPNPHIDFEGLNVFCASDATPLERDKGQALVAGVNSFGFGGVNAHVLVQEFCPPSQVAPPCSIQEPPASLPPLFLSARSNAALRSMAHDYAQRIEGATPQDYYDIACAAALRRNRLEKRLATVADTPTATAQALRHFAAGEPSSAVCLEDAPAQSGDIAFVYTGNGSQWHGMGRRMLAESPLFARTLASLDAAMRPLAGFSLLEELANGTAARLQDTTISQPLLFAIQIGVTALLRERGIAPKAVMGHSVGEIAAAWAAGALSLDQAARVICARSQAQGLTRGMGRMAVVGLSEAATRALLQETGTADAVEIAGMNAPGNVTLSGSLPHLLRIQEYTRSQNIFFHLLELEYAFHSRHMDGIKTDLLSQLEGLAPTDAASALFVSSVTGAVLDPRALDSGYWWDNVRRPVRFVEAMSTLARLGCRLFVEIGPHAILQRYMRDCMAVEGLPCRAFPTLLRDRDGARRITKTALRLHMLADTADRRALFPYPGRPVALPGYPWQKERHWHPRTSECLPEKRRVHPLLGWPQDGTGLTWETILDPALQIWLADHTVGGAIVFPGAGYAEMALAAAHAWTGEEHCAVASLRILMPLLFEGGHAQCVRCALDPRDGSFQMHSRPRLGTGAWVLHASGRIIAGDRRLPTTALPPLSADSRTLGGAVLYAKAAALGLEYGPAFRVVQDVRMDGDRFEATLTPLDADAPGYLLHPILLDAAFHSLVALQQDDTLAQAFLPVQTGRLDRCREGVVTHIRAQVRRRSRRSITVDFELLDATQSLVAKAAGCRFLAVPLKNEIGHERTVSAWSTRPWLCPHPSEACITVTPPLDVLVRHLDARFVEHAQERQAWFHTSLPLLEALVLAFVREALQTVANSHPGALESLVQQSAPYTRWLLGLLRREGLLREENGFWTFAEQHDLPDAGTLFELIVRDAPECLPHLLRMGRVGRRLAAVLLGREDGPALLAELRQAPVLRDSQAGEPALWGTRLALTEMLTRLACDWPAHRRLRILEVSTSFDALTETLLKALPEDRFRHVMALTDEEARMQAQARFGDCAAVSVVPLDVSDWTSLHASLEIFNDVFDVVILRHALHSAADIRGAIAAVRRTLAPEGLLLVAERHPDWSEDIVEGLDPAWWHESAGADMPVSSLCAPQAWQQLFTEEGFAQCRVYSEPAAEGLAEGAYLLLMTASVAVSERPVPDVASWLLLTDAASEDLAAALHARLLACGQQVALTAEVPCAMPSDVAHVVVMLGAQDKADAVTPTLNKVLQCVRACTQRETLQPRLWIVTRGGALVTLPQGCVVNPAQSALWGFGRVVMHEYPDLHCTLVDIVATMPAPDAALRLERELLHPDGVSEVLLTGNAEAARYALMLREECPEASADVPPDTVPDTRFILDFAVAGRLQNLAWRTAEAGTLGQDEIEARVMAAGLNFRDVMLVMGLLPDDAVENGFAGTNLGLEFSGVVTRVGEGVNHVAPGDAVLGFAPSCFASHVVTPAHTVARLPEGWSHEAAATVPTVFLTAWYAMKHLAQLQPGERVLIHGAAGGVGLAAIQVARHLGAEIIATAGSEEKHDLLRMLGVTHIFDSRSLFFAEDIRAVTDNQGVDVVLNSLAGEAMRRSLDVLKPFGRFLELGKRDFIENTSLGLRPLKDNISYFAIDVDQLLTGRPRLAATVFQEVMALFQSGVFMPLPHRTFAAAQVVAAFRTMQQARHIGKIVVACADAPPLPPAPSLPQKTLEHTEGTWLITGGLSGFGLATARWLTECGVKHLVLTGRRGPQSPGVDALAADFARCGVTAHILACDVADAAAVHALIHRIRETLPPLKGVVHAAAVFDDRILANLDAHSLEAVLAPKLSGAWHLHQATLDDPPEHFVLYSSVSTALGNPGQANYVAANAGLEGLTQLRRHLGLPAVCIAWGPIGDVGYLASHETVRKSLEQRLSRPALTSAVALEQFAAAITRDGEVRTLANLDWNVVKRALPRRGISRFDMVTRTADSQNGTDSAVDMRARLAGKSAREMTAIMSGLIVAEVAQVLTLNEEHIDPHRSLQSLGMDSLMAVELAVGLEQRTGLHLPAMIFQDAPTTVQLAARIVARLTGEAGDNAAPATEAAAELARRHGETLTEADAEAMAQGMAEHGGRA